MYKLTITNLETNKVEVEETTDAIIAAIHMNELDDMEKGAAVQQLAIFDKVDCDLVANILHTVDKARDDILNHEVVADLYKKRKAFENKA